MALHNQLGKLGEEAAATYLERKGYVIVERNWRHHHLELDIIASDGRELVFVEVKTLNNNRFRDPQEAVTRQKMRHLLCAANAYLCQHPVDGPVRFDIIAITGRPDHFHIEHFEDAFSSLDY